LRTSSNLNGLIIAMMFFIIFPLHDAQGSAPRCDLFFTHSVPVF
jgi:hypothetical protein